MICAGQVTGVEAGVVGGLEHTPPLGTSTSILSAISLSRYYPLTCQVCNHTECWAPAVPASRPDGPEVPEKSWGLKLNEFYFNRMESMGE